VAPPHGSTFSRGRAIESEHVVDAARPRRPSFPEAILGAIVGLWRLAPLRWSALAALLAAYAVMSLQPFEWRFPRSLPNGATPLAEGWAFGSAGILIADAPLDGFASAIEAETLDVSLEVRPRSTSLSGWAPILTISQGVQRRNLTLAQDGDDLVLGLRSQDTGRRGREAARLAGVLAAGRWLAIDVGLRPGRLTIAIDGMPMLAVALPPVVLGSWDPGSRLALGNETSCERPWLGDLRKAVIAGPDGATDYALAGRTEAPAACRILRHPPKLAPLVPLNRWDALRNTVMYLPLGCLLGMMVRRRNRRSFAALLPVIAGVSLAFEMLQLLVPNRYPSIDDVIFNTAGGALGLCVGFWLMARLAPWLPERRA
jgi:VanZ family protein